MIACSFLSASAASAADAPQWMHALTGVPSPAHDERTNAVLLYSEAVLTVQPNGQIRRLEREAYRILRPDGEEHGTVRVNFDAQTRILSLRGWCIPSSGKDYEVKEKDAVESSLTDVENGDLVTDLRTRILRIPAATPGNIVGYELEQEQRPYVLADEWEFQDTVPVREAHYSLQLPHGWTYQTTWIHHDETQPASTASGQLEWVVKDISPIRLEERMPPWRGVAARMFVALTPPTGQEPGIRSWREMGAWYLNLTRGRRDITPEIRQKVQELTASAPTPLAKLNALAGFVQNDIRYVAIELGIGGHQPHPAADVFTHRYGDCKDKVTLLSAMLKEIGIESYYVIINTERGSVTASTPANLGFNHAILAIALPAELQTDTTLLARLKHPKLGNLLFFDPTDELTPLGRVTGALQANYGLLVAPDGGELVELPKLPADSNGVDRTAKLTLDEQGTLHGDVVEVRSGDRASQQRYYLRSATRDTDQIKPVESVLAHSFTSYQILKASVANLRVPNRPFEWHYSLEAEHYANTAGDLLLVRPRVLGSLASGLLETRDPRENPIEFEGPERDTDLFEITLPAGYKVDELPPPVSLDNEYVSYQSKSEVVGNTLRYRRSFEVKELNVPASKADELRHFYRVIGDDERNSAVLKQTH